MAAVASDTYAIFDLEHIIDCNGFLDSCTQLQTRTYNNNSDNYEYTIILKLKRIQYRCIVSIPNVNKKTCTFSIYFLNNSLERHYNPLYEGNTSTFLLLMVDDAVGINSALTTRVDKFNLLPHPFKTNTTLSKLETIIYIQCLFYRMIGITEYIISDATSITCDGPPKTRYSLLDYRFFATRTNETPVYSIKDLSIYYKFFNYKLQFYNKKTKNFQLIQLDQIKESDNEFEKYIYDMYTKYRQLVVSQFSNISKDFTRFSKCNTYANKIKTIHESLYTPNNTYYNFLNLITRFKVNNKDCIYYPKDTANIDVATQPGGSRYTKKRRYRKKHRRSTRK